MDQLQILLRINKEDMGADILYESTYYIIIYVYKDK